MVQRDRVSHLPEEQEQLLPGQLLVQVRLLLRLLVRLRLLLRLVEVRQAQLQRRLLRGLELLQPRLRLLLLLVVMQQQAEEGEAEPQVAALQLG